MTKILFVCHGNICRSPMAEFVMKELVRRAGLEHEFLIESAATSREEIGNDIHYGTRTKLREMGIPLPAALPARLPMPITTNMIISLPWTTRMFTT